MEQVGTTLTPLRGSVGAVCDPADPVPGHRSDARELFVRQAPVDTVMSSGMVRLNRTCSRSARAGPRMAAACTMGDPDDDACI